MLARCYSVLGSSGCRSQLLFSDMGKELQDKVLEHVTLESCLETVTGVRMGNKMIRNVDEPANLVWTGRLPCDCYPISTA